MENQKESPPIEPLILVVGNEKERIKTGLFQMFDTSPLPNWLLEGILEEVLIDVKIRADSERVRETEKYLRMLNDYHGKDGKSE